MFNPRGGLNIVSLFRYIDIKECNGVRIEKVATDETTQDNYNQENEYTFALKNGLITCAFVKNSVSIPCKFY